MVMGSCEIRFRQKQDYHVLNPLPPFYPDQLAETKVKLGIYLEWAIWATFLTWQMLYNDTWLRYRKGERCHVYITISDRAGWK
jgi:hypothetical protein